jgi:hypothetical protein
MLYMIHQMEKDVFYSTLSNLLLVYLTILATQQWSRITNSDVITGVCDAKPLLSCENCQTLKPVTNCIKWNETHPFPFALSYTRRKPFKLRRKQLTLLIWIELMLSGFYARSQNCENRLLASSCPSVRPSAWNTSGPTGPILIQLDIWDFFENLSEKLKFH